MHKVQVGSSAYEPVLLEAASIRQLFQSIERPHGGQEPKARSSIRSRALDDPKRVYTSSNDKNVQGVRTPLCQNTFR
jgi:hypothetical protein